AKVRRLRDRELAPLTLGQREEFARDAHHGSIELWRHAVAGEGAEPGAVTRVSERRYELPARNAVRRREERAHGAVRQRGHRCDPSPRVRARALLYCGRDSSSGVRIMFRAASVRVIIVPAALLVLAGCAGMSEQACKTSDWRTVGFEDGSLGRSEAMIANYR